MVVSMTMASLKCNMHAERKKKKMAMKKEDEKEEEKEKEKENTIVLANEYRNEYICDLCEPNNSKYSYPFIR